MIPYYELKAKLNRGEIEPAYLVKGADKYWSGLAYKELVSLASDVDLSVFEGDDAVDEAIWALGSFPMISERKVVVINGRKFKESEIKTLNQYMLNPMSTSVLVLFNCEGEIKGVSVCDCPILDEMEVIPYIQRIVLDRKSTITSSAAKLLCEYCENDMTRINNELIKLIALGNVTDDLVKKYVEPSTQYRVFDFTEAISRGSYTDAYSVLSSLAKNAYEYSPFFAKLTDYVRLMLHSRIAGKNTTANDIAAAFGMSLYPVQKAKRAAEAYTPKQLLDILMKYYALEEGYKSGQITIETAMDLAIVEAIEARKK